MWLFFSSFIVIVVSQDCDYNCKANKGCTVKYVGPPRAGKLSGSCFPQSFGGSCSGTPRECQDCNKVLTCGSEGSQKIVIGSHNSNSSSGSNQSNDLCRYECKSDGGCGATYVGPFRSGSTSGSCFSKSFGGACFGIPSECDDSCHHFCFDGQLIQTQTTRPTQRTTRLTQRTTRSTIRPTTTKQPRSTQQITKSTHRTTGPTQETTRSTIRATTTKQPPSKILKPNEEEFVENVNKIEFEIETIRESSLAFVLKEDIIDMKMTVGEIMELDEDLNSHERRILQNVSDVTKQLFYFHQIIENNNIDEETNGSPDQFLVGVSKNEDCDLECLQAKFPWLRVARSVSHRRFRRQNEPSKGPNEQSKLDNVKNGQSAVDEADDSAIRVKSLLEEYKQGLVDSSKCDAGKKKLVKILETEAQNMNKQLEAAMKSIQDFFDEKIKTITVQGTGKSWRFKRCELIWGREFVNEVGESGSIAEESADSATECEKECDKYDDCVCWSFKDGVCHLKDESYCEKLSDNWDINVVSAINVQCLERVEVCSTVTDTCDWRPARELDLGSCNYKPGAIMVEGNLPERDEESACAGCQSNGPEDCAHKCSTYDQCKAWSVKKNTNACWLFSSPANNVKKDAEKWVYGFPCKSSGTMEDIEAFKDAGDISKEDFEYIQNALASDPWKDAEARRMKDTLNKYRAGNGTEKYLMQDDFDQLHKMLNKEQKSEVYYAIQSDAEVNLARLESVAHDPVYEPDPDPNTACTANEDAGECKQGSTNSNTRKKHREMRDIFELTKSKDERLTDNKEFGAGMLNLIPDIDIPNDPNAQTKRKKAELMVKSIQQVTDPTVRKKLINDLEKQFLTKRGCCFESNELTQKAITMYIESSKMLDIENNKQKAQNALNRAQFLSDSDKEKFQDFINADENDQTVEAKDKRKKAKEDAGNKLNDVKEQRNRRGYQFGSKLVNKLRGSGAGTGNAMNAAKKPKHYRRSFARTFRSSSTVSKINGFSNALSTVVQSIEKFKSEDPLDIASGTMDIIGSIAAFAGPYGAAFSAVLGVVSIFMGLFKKPGPSQIEVITNLVNDQTELLVGKIDEQTEILIETMKALNDATVNSIVTSIEQDSWRDMINEMKGATNSLKTKKTHLEEYRFSCILGWIEIALESDMQHITRSLGKVSSFMTWYCYSRKNIPFCGDMVFQYVMLANLRNSVRAETINIVSNSGIHNGRNKLHGLLAEYRTELDFDKELLKKVLQAFDQEDPEWKLLCFATCAFNKVKDEFENDNLEGSPDMKLAKSQKKFILQYLAKLGVKEDFDKKMCPVCYKDTPCKKGFERGPITKKCEKPRKLSKGRKTDWSQNHDGSAHYLSHIPFECRANEALTQFRLKNVNDRLRFFFSCATSHDNGAIERSSKSYSTRKLNYNWELHYQFDFAGEMFETPCSGKEVLAGIKFKYDEDDDKMWWEFECAKVPYKLKCKNKATSCKNNGHETSGLTSGEQYYVQYMDRHDLDCGDEGFMRGFLFKNCVDKNSKGRKPVRGYWRYSGLKFHYSCCYVDK